ncbi:hypothetical protein C8N40_111126 [Pontibacter mucosus]|uniref:Uncharacterized protein n=1 Tax=Pontibacter mucosus TaxID=1649266 RepID=A0A2T5YD68_9BACT|nr:hypothetical protein [Pontibacter mucosus]PTX14461.1 hypothetical protein C8N40_111126 [Pontibacter mucosus]
MEPLSVALEAQVQAFEGNIAKAIQSVQNFGTQAERMPAVRPKFEDTITRTLSDLNAKLRVAQGNAEIFGNQFEADKLKVVAMQQALNTLLSAGLSPTSKQVLKLADDIESLSGEITKAEKAASRADLFVSFQKTGKIIPDLEAKAQRLRAAMRNATDVKDIERYGKRLQVVNNELAELNQRGRMAAMNTANGMNRLAGSAGTVNMEIARIVQDAPYGMMGIGNNIQQLTANFGQLAAQAGGTGVAIKAALASMLTPASLLTLGIAAITSGWVLYERWSQKSAKATKESANAMQDAASKAQEYINSLDVVNRARATGQREAQQELVTLKLLYERTQNVSLSMQERVKAVDELQKQYPAYFKNLKDEDILAGNASEAYRKLSKSIQDYATAQASLSLITEKAQQRQVNLLQLRDLREQEKQQEVAIQQANELKAAQDAAAASMNARGGTGSVLGAQNVLKLNNALGETQEKIAAIIAENRKLDEEMALLTSDATPALFTEDPGTKKKQKEQTDYLKQLREGWRQVTQEFLTYGNAYQVVEGKAKLLETAINGLISQGAAFNSPIIEKLKAQLDSINEIRFDTLENTFELSLKRMNDEAIKFAKDFKPQQIDLIQSPEQSRFFEEQARQAGVYFDILQGRVMGVSTAVDGFINGFQAKIDQVQAMTGLVTEFAGNAFASLGEGIGNMFQGLASGADVLQGVGRALLQTMSQIAAEFGKKLLAIGVGETLMKIPTGPAKIAAGAALIAAAGIGGSLASGRGSAAPSVSTSSISGTASGPMMMSYEGDDELRFRIEGNDLVAVMDRANYKSRRTRG